MRILGSLVLIAFAAAATPAAAQPYPFSEAVRAGDILYLSGQIGVAPGTAKPVSGGVTAETRQAMDNIGATLRRHGLGYGHLVRCMVMLTDMTQWPELNRVYASYFPDGRYPARSAIGASTLALGAQVEIECTARVPAAPRAINPGTPLGPYSQAVSTGGLVYISGVIAYDADRKQFAEATIDAQMRQVFANLDSVLAGAGVRREDIVKTTLFLRDPKDMPAANAAYAAYFSGAKPARTSVPGADWGRPEILVEIEAVAVAADRPNGGKP
ncbi:MAG TPA: RidA family protein [Allosphingosinicella sp.]